MKQETEKNVMWRSAICSLNLFHPYWISDDHKFQSFTFETKFPNFSILVIRVNLVLKTDRQLRLATGQSWADVPFQ